MLRINVVITFGLFVFPITSVAIAYDGTAKVIHCNVARKNPTLAKAFQNSRLVFIGEAHSSNSTKLVSETDILEHFCNLNRPLILLTEFIWPRWQTHYDQWMSDPLADLSKFIQQNVKPSAFDSVAFEERFTDLFLWTRRLQLPVKGIDLDDFGNGEIVYELPNFSQELKVQIAKAFEISDYMIDEVTQRDIHMAVEVLRAHRELPGNAIIIVYTGANHIEKIPSLLGHQIPMSKMMSLYLGAVEAGSKSSMSIQKQILLSQDSPATYFIYPQYELDNQLKYGSAIQRLIRLSPSLPALK